MRTNKIPTLLLRTEGGNPGSRFMAWGRPDHLDMARAGGACLVLMPQPALDRSRLGGTYRLTPRQQVVAKLLWHRRTNSEIG